MSAGASDPFAAASAVADAVLYEGYVLYPYRASARKNQMRWQFGVLCPRSFAEMDASERWFTRSECLLRPGGQATLAVRVRALQLQRRVVEPVEPTTAAAGTASEWARPGGGLDGGLEVDGKRYVSFDEAVEVVVDLPALELAALCRRAESRRSESRRSESRRAEIGAAGDALVAPLRLEHRFCCEGGTTSEQIRARSGALAGSIIRSSSRLEGRVLVSATTVETDESLWRIAVKVENLTAWEPQGIARRDEVLDRSLIAVHTLLSVEGGRFVSLLDPPASAIEAVADCRNEGSFPVIVGEADDVVLSSPIILYDHPAVAPESGGDLYDATEIDEILALRVLTLTEEEKAEARGTDPRSAAIVDRCEAMSTESWEQLHGAIRSLRGAGGGDEMPQWDAGGGESALAGSEMPQWDAGGGESALAGSEMPQWAAAGEAGGGADEAPWWDPAADASVDPWSDSVLVGAVEVHAGTPLRLHPSRRADAQDLFLAGLSATCAGVFRDVDGAVLVAVTLDDDPASGELAWQGRHLFFHPDEVEPLVVGRQP